MAHTPAFIITYVVAPRATWARVAVRVAGSWIVAIRLLMLGWTVRLGGA